MKVKGMIFAAGIGSRLRPLTDTTPKALIEVGGKTMLERTIERMNAAGIDQIVVNIHHHAKKVKEYLAANSNFGLDISISDESALLLDTGGGLLKAQSLLKDADVLVLHNADVLTDIDLRGLIDSLTFNKADAVLAMKERQSSRRLIFEVNGRLKGWINTTTGEKRGQVEDADLETASLGFCGIHAVRTQRIFPALDKYSKSKGDVFSLTPFYVDSAEELDIRCQKVPAQSTWIDIGKPATLEQARASFNPQDL